MFKMNFRKTNQINVGMMVLIVSLVNEEQLNYLSTLSIYLPTLPWRNL